MTKWLLIALGASVLSLIGLGVYTYYQHTVISSQALTIASQQVQIESLEKQKAARDKVAIQRKKDQTKIEQENKSLKEKLSESLKGNPCDDAPLPDDTKRMLEELYRGRS